MTMILHWPGCAHAVELASPSYYTDHVISSRLHGILAYRPDDDTIRWLGSISSLMSRLMLCHRRRWRYGTRTLRNVFAFMGEIEGAWEKLSSLEFYNVLRAADLLKFVSLYIYLLLCFRKVASMLVGKIEERGRVSEKRTFLLRYS